VHTTPRDQPWTAQDGPRPDGTPKARPGPRHRDRDGLLYSKKRRSSSSWMRRPPEAGTGWLPPILPEALSISTGLAILTGG